MYTFEELVEGFQKLGVNKGDTLLVHSSYKSLGEVEGGPADGGAGVGDGAWHGR